MEVFLIIINYEFCPPPPCGHLPQGRTVILSLAGEGGDEVDGCGQATERLNTSASGVTPLLTQSPLKLHQSPPRANGSI